jgi:hypothetical protein
MGATYNEFSPWANTPVIGNNFLGQLEIRPVSAESDDFLYTIQPQYNLRPDLLAYDLYGRAELWWVFIQRNMDVIEDPILDFVAGKQIYIPKNSALMQALGL